jgi:hypothetical protein
MADNSWPKKRAKWMPLGTRKKRRQSVRWMGSVTKWQRNDRQKHIEWTGNNDDWESEEIIDVSDMNIRPHRIHRGWNTFLFSYKSQVKEKNILSYTTGLPRASNFPRLWTVSTHYFVHTPKSWYPDTTYCTRDVRWPSGLAQVYTRNLGKWVTDLCQKPGRQRLSLYTKCRFTWTTWHGSQPEKVLLWGWNA